MKTGQVDLARRDQEVAVNQIDDAIGKVRRKVRAVVSAAIFSQTTRDIDARPALTQSELDVWVGLVVAQQDVEPWLALLDEIVFKRQRFFVVADDDIVHVDSLAHQRAGF